jgi:arylsulfatase
MNQRSRNLRLLTLFFVAALLATNALAPERAGAQTGNIAAQPEKHPYNILFIISDQEQYKLLTAAGYNLPARHRLAERGITFRNHYIASAMCSPSRAALLTGQPPQRNGVFDQMEYAYVPTLSTSFPTMGSVLKTLGYSTAYFGKFEMDKGILTTKDTVNYKTALQPYGFDTFAASGDVGSSPDSGYKNDSFTAGEAVRWLRASGLNSGKGGKPFFLVASFLNPHDIMYANANMPNEEVQKGLSHKELTFPPDNTLYQKKWTFDLPPSLQESLTAPGMPSALAEYRDGWSQALGFIPTDRKDMWQSFNNYYLNLVRDNDQTLQQLVDVLEETNLWKNTIVILTADHGEMGGSHGGLRGKGPFAYEENSKAPFIIVHPDYPGGTSDVLTSHLDLLPTLVGLTGLPEARRKEAVKGLPGKDFSGTLTESARTNVHAIRQGVLFNYVAPLTIDKEFCAQSVSSGSSAAAKSAINLASLKPHLGKRGFLTFASDGRYKFARYYAPNAFNTPKTLNEIFQYNDVQLFDLQDDPNEMNNLALDPEKNKDTLLRMNALLNDLMAKEVGTNDGSFLPKEIRPTGEVTFNQQ